MYTISLTEAFSTWLAELKDLKARAKIMIFIKQASRGNFGEIKPITLSVCWMRVHFGPDNLFSMPDKGE